MCSFVCMLTIFYRWSSLKVPCTHQRTAAFPSKRCSRPPSLTTSPRWCPNVAPRCFWSRTTAQSLRSLH
ncbi:hypothetical protein PR003_g13359 [Phytophthora rubi]|uniref:Secreted protein n=1 Tax=Phytophthora rubi TaxID=129364 RepID=A0A6A3M366_9STRA|nr:hypothetical protein PR002_g11911 [Phytophthora rubi]KAE9334772.1 hypothetical protein PR003_g13359 [Phytophthora rubi]